MSVRVTLAIIAALAAAAPSTAAFAQSGMGVTSETGTLITRRPAEIHGESTVAARATLKQFGVCSLQRRPTLALQVIDLPVDTAEYERLIRRIPHDDCISSGELRLSLSLLRGSLFEALYLRDFGKFAKPDFKGVPPIDYTKGYARPLSGEGQKTIALAYVADCVVRTAPVGAHELITSHPGSDLEDKAVFVVSRHLPGCIPPNQTIKFSRAVIRSSVAEAIYRLSGSSKAAQTGAAQ